MLQNVNDVAHRVTANLFICRCLSVKCAAAVNLLRVRGDDKLAEIYRQRIERDTWAETTAPPRSDYHANQSRHSAGAHIMDAGRAADRANALLLKIFIKERASRFVLCPAQETRGEIKRKCDMRPSGVLFRASSEIKYTLT